MIGRMPRTIGLCTCLVLAGVTVQTTADDGDPKAEALVKARRDQLRQLYLGDAASYIIHRGPGHTEKTEMRREPVYSWINPLQVGGQDGDVFVWTYRGRAEAVGTIYSTPKVGPRRVVHEFHSLSLATLEVERPGGATVWKPLAPGIVLKPVSGAPAPARSASVRLSQMKELGRGFAATATNFQGRKWELRLLPQPLYRYESTDPAVLDGAVFGFVTTAGTDPELILVLEARPVAGQANPVWQFAAARFTNMALVLRVRDEVVFEAPLLRRDDRRDEFNRYHATTDRTIPAVEEIAPSTDQTPDSRPKP